MTSPRVILPEEEEGAGWDGVEWEGGVAKSDYLAQNYASLRLMVA